MDELRRLVGTLTNGDIRRAILADVDLNLTVAADLTGTSGSAFL